MWWHKHRAAAGRAARIALALGAAGLVAGCFQPLYGEHSLAGGPGTAERLSAVEVLPIQLPNGSPQGRLAVQLRNDLIFDLTGGSGVNSPTHQLKIQMTAINQQVIVDYRTTRPDVQQYGIAATYSLIDSATGKVVLTGETFSRVSYDNPGQEQRFAGARGQRDAENRAAQVVSEAIRSRLASYFLAGT
jgi:LPS-assembly lipoprotein